MKIPSLVAAGLVALAGLSPAIADAQTRVVTRTVTHEHTHTGPTFGHRRVHRECRVDIRHGHRVRTCRTVRY